VTFPYGQTVTLISRTVSGQDGYGNDVYAETSTDVSPCIVQPAGSVETIQWTDEVSTDLTVFLPFGTDIEAIDAVEINGIRYEVQGEPSNWTSPFTGRNSPEQIRVSKVTGASV
jgi:hypothetical protein